MTDQSDSYRGTRLLIIAATFMIIIWGINQARSVMVLFLVSFFLAVIGTVPVLWMKRKRIPSVAAVLIVMTAQGKKMLEGFQQKHSKPRNYLSVNYINMSKIKRNRRIKRNGTSKCSTLQAHPPSTSTVVRGLLPRFCVMPLYPACIDLVNLTNKGEIYEEKRGCVDRP